MFRGFRDFFLRGNVIHLSVAVTIGMAFTALVTTLVNNWIGPLFAALGGSNATGLSVSLVEGNLKTQMDFGAILTALAGFMIIATVVYYLIVLPVKELQLRRALTAKALPREPTEVELLAEIRGLLSQQQRAVGPAVAEGTGPIETNWFERTNDRRKVTIDGDREFSSRLVVLRPNTPGLVIDYGGEQLTFTVGQGKGGVAKAHEFASDLAYAALAFAHRCRVEMSPRHAAPPASA
ncbi:MAG TPA: MscL family protein [Actinophytocola sp.]|uniref:MscL family protein n=1 Tax=Actinophytocola sp. TaxID=1872138 RepID=UPI002DDD5C6D|nr:MscL family protein [Actinophytocola sp.]HEV2783429.1 MscL family protein [Actinophytocola sp.]